MDKIIKEHEKQPCTIHVVSGSTEVQKCMENNCKENATKDYNGHGHWVCERHYDKLSDYFDDEYS